jgi:hypothetical protein
MPINLPIAEWQLPRFVAERHWQVAARCEIAEVFSPGPPRLQIKV